MVWVVGQGISRGVNRRRSGRLQVGSELAPRTPRCARRTGLLIIGVLGGRPGRACGAVGRGGGEAKASTRDQAWRWADGRMGGIYREIMEAVDDVVGPADEAKASTQNQAWRGGAIDGIYQDLSRDIGIYREIMEAVGEVAGPVGEAKASTQNQAWRWADGRRGDGEAKASTQNQAWRRAYGRMPSLF